MIQVVEQKIGVGFQDLLRSQDLVLLNVLFDDRDDVEESDLCVPTRRLYFDLELILLLQEERQRVWLACLTVIPEKLVHVRNGFHILAILRVDLHLGEQRRLFYFFDVIGATIVVTLSRFELLS